VAAAGQAFGMPGCAWYKLMKSTTTMMMMMMLKIITAEPRKFKKRKRYDVIYLKFVYVSVGHLGRPKRNICKYFDKKLLKLEMPSCAAI